MMIFQKELFPQPYIFLKNQQTTKNHEKLPNMQRVNTYPATIFATFTVTQKLYYIFYFRVCDQIPIVELRKACVHLLLSLLCLPLHFKDLEIKGKVSHRFT